MIMQKREDPKLKKTSTRILDFNNDIKCKNKLNSNNITLITFLNRKFYVAKMATVATLPPLVYILCTGVCLLFCYPFLAFIIRDLKNLAATSQLSRHTSSSLLTILILTNKIQPENTFFFFFNE